ncbi:Uncharacterized protein PCOAH_00014520 [Plasmodium coatneyi]|uniref:Formin 2 n=1 Tax=Plasmodium coatneyi TaxID=208452 RepID=A0A1B1DWI5_9APIC|nr:Uncharacterized protein PCOAH_00014520 [Plasmodium coatneyi]ANQ07153.1 Uncharacterized protein PCOAH_00014520 [Plasmodium coatneyi]
MMKGYATSKRGPMNNTPFGDMRKISLTNPLHISDNAWSTDRITLSSEEYLYYVNLFNLNDKFDSHFIDNKTASSFLQNSGLSISVLHSIWEYSDVENKGYLTLEDFFICCRLVAHAQNGNALNSDIINIQPPCLPSFDIIRHKSFSDISNMEGNVEWKISAREREDYRRIFKTLDMNNEEKVEGSVIREYYLNTSNLSICELMQIWSVSDMDNDGFLNFEQFCVMNKMVEVRKEKEINIPLAIPADLLNSIKEDQQMVLDDDVTFRKVEDKEKRDSLKLTFGDLLKTENEKKKEKGASGKGASSRSGSPENNEKLNMEFDFFEFKQEEKSDMDSSEKEKSKRKKKKEKDIFSERSEKKALFKNDFESYTRLDKEDDDDDDDVDEVDEEEEAERRNSVEKKKGGMKEPRSYEELSTEEMSTEESSKKGKEKRKEKEGDEDEEDAEGGAKRRIKMKKKEKANRDRSIDRLSKAKEKQKDRQRKGHEKKLQLEKYTPEEATSRAGDVGGPEKGRNMHRGSRDMNSGNGKVNAEEEKKKKTSQSEKYFTKLIDFNYSDLKNYNIESKDVYKIEEINRKLEEEIEKKKKSIEKKKKQVNCLAYVYENELKKYQCLKEERRNLEFINLCLYKDIKHKKENIRSIKNEIKELIEDINKISIENVNINKEYIKKEKEIKVTDNKRKNLNALIDKEKNDLKKDERNLIILKNMIDYLRKQKSRALKLQENLKNRYDVTNSDHQMLIKNILHQQNYLNRITQKRLNTQKVKNQNLLYFNSLCNQSALLDMQNNTHASLRHPPDAKALAAHRRYFTDRKGIPNEQSDELKSSKRNVELFEHIKNGDSVDIFSSMDDESGSQSQEYVEEEEEDDDDEDGDYAEEEDEKRQKGKNNMEDLANLVSKDHSLNSVDDSS